jgi:hypothetical protein
MTEKSVSDSACDKSSATLQRCTWIRVRKKKTANFIKTEVQNLLNEVEMLWTLVLTRGTLPVANNINDLIVYV